jgi:serine/threonine protein kinase
MGESNGSEFHVRVIVRALEKKLISSQQTLTLIDALQNTKVDSLGALFVAHDLLDTSEYAAHEASVQQESLHSTVTDLDEPTPPWSSKLSPRYQLQEKVGRGGTGYVYRAKDQALERAVAIKVLRRHEEGEHRINPNQFIREAICLAAMDSKHVPVVLDRGFDEGDPFLAMEFYPRTLQDEIKLLHSLQGVEQKTKLRAIVDYLKTTCEAASHAHQKGMAHRDIKPGNILISDSKAVLGDWGLASTLMEQPKTTEGEDGNSPEGSPGQRSPESFICYQASRTTGHDVFALGATLYRILANELPPEPFRKTDSVESKLHFPAEPLVSICMKAMSPVKSRYGSAADFAVDLDAWLAGHLPKAHESPARKIGYWSKANIWLLVAGLVAASIAVGAFIFVTAAQQRVDNTEKKVEASDETVEKLINELLVEPTKEFGELTNTSGTYLHRKDQLESAARMAQELIDKRGTTDDQLRLIKILQRRAELETRIGNDKEALESLNDSSKLIEMLASGDDANLKMQKIQASQFYQQAGIYRQHGEFLKSINAMQRAVEIREVLAVKGEVNQDQLAFAYLSLGYMELEQRQLGPAKDNLGVAISNLESRIQAEPKNANIYRGLGEAYLKLSVCYAIEKDFEEGKLAVAASAKHFATLLEKFPEHSNMRQMHALTIYNLGQMEIDSGNTLLGVKEMEKAARKLDGIISDNPNDGDAINTLGRALEGIAKGYLKLDNYKEARSAAVRALAIHEGKESLLAKSQFYRACLVKGDALQGMKDFEKAGLEYKVCLAGCKEMLEENPKFKIAQTLCEATLTSFLSHCREQGRFDDAFDEISKLLEWGKDKEYRLSVFAVVSVLNQHGLEVFGKADDGDLSSMFESIALTISEHIRDTNQRQHYALYIEAMTRCLEIGSRSNSKEWILEHMSTLDASISEMTDVKAETADMLRKNLAETKANSLNRAAWRLVEAEDMSNAAVAVELATKACEASEWRNSAMLDTLAAASALSGDLEKAIEYQGLAVEHATSKDKDAMSITLKRYCDLHESD